jgi:GNAT superfamily N-acetyltransferase
VPAEIRSFLQMDHPTELTPSTRVTPELEVERLDPPDASLCASLYLAIGQDHYWIDRRSWLHARWAEHLKLPDVQVWLARQAGQVAGYAELHRVNGGGVEISYFGLLPAFVGQGLGGPFLSEVVQQAWATPAARVLVDTSTLDHPNALRNYQARGFKVVRSEERVVGEGE